MDHEHFKIDFSRRQFVDVDGLGTIVQEAIMPIAAVVRGTVHHLGSGFVVANCGFMVTARHVVNDLVKRFTTRPVLPEQVIDGNDEFRLVALYVGGSHPSANCGDLFGGLLPICRVTYSGASDLALLTLQLPVISGTRLDLPVMPLCPTIPHVGEEIAGLGYSLMRSEGRVGEKLLWHQLFHASRGKIEEVHEVQRDKSMINFPSFRTDSRFDHGMSGGPILGLQRSGVVGVVSSAMKPHDESSRWTSHAALIGPLMDLKAPINVNGESTVLTVREMAELGIITYRECGPPA